ncbi:hypothetical protein F4806DRAFT_332152 [Annulohypoxylon nitens]|nr:hypothetical protein F4806DRAFT_332152 [Annulohypoxylon nitens]
MASIRDLLSPIVDRGSKEPEANSRDASPKLDNEPETTHFVVEFILDLVCPYCYIGFKNLTAAIETYTKNHPEATFDVVCSPYMLDPLATRSAYDKSTYLNIPKRSIEYWTEQGAQAGISFVWSGRTGSTRDAHKLLRFALEAAPTTVRSTAYASQQQTTSSSPDPLSSPRVHPEPPRGPALQMQWLTALLRAHHETDADISSRGFLTSLFSPSSSHPSSSSPNHPTLSDLPALPDLSPSTIQTLLTSPSWDRALDVLFADSCSRPGLTVRAVPTFIINDRYVVGGAQSVAFWVEELERVRVGKGGRRIGEDDEMVDGVGEDGMSARFYGDGEGERGSPSA